MKTLLFLLSAGLAALAGLAAYAAARAKRASVLVVSDSGAGSVCVPGTSAGSAYDSVINKYAEIYQVPANLIAAIIKIESSFNAHALNASDPSYGLMQIQHKPGGWSTALAICKELGINPPSALPDALYDPDFNVQLGAKFLSEIYLEYGIDDVDIYNVGETQFHKGLRNLEYRDKVLTAYRAYEGA